MSRTASLTAQWLRACWRGLLTVALLLPVLLMLGLWQVDRAAEKREINRNFEALLEQAPVALEKLEQPANYQRVIISGRFDPQRYWLLDNRILQGRFGYEVVGLFELDAGGEVLVNRGWIAGDPSRRELPEVAMPEGRQSLQGDVYRGHGKPFSLQDEAESESWPRRIQWLNVEAVQQELGEQLYPFTVRLAEGQAGALTVSRQTVNIQPERHTGYAVQWFGIALVLLAIAGFRGYRTLDRLRSGQQEESQH